MRQEANLSIGYIKYKKAPFVRINNNNLRQFITNLIEISYFDVLKLKIIFKIYIKNTLKINYYCNPKYRIKQNKP